MENAKSAIATCELPTGVEHDGEVIKSVTFRELSGYEEDILASRKMKTTNKMTQLMSNCIIKLGVIEDRQTISKLVKKLIITDRWYLLTQLRIHSLGAQYKFPSECPSCSKQDDKMYDLMLMKIKQAPVIGNLMKEVTLPSGKSVRFRVADGLVEEKIEALANDENAATVAMFARIMEIGDLPVNMDIVKSLSWADRQFLRKEIDLLEGELEDEYEAICPHCGHEYKSSVPMSAENFFFPSV